MMINQDLQRTEEKYTHKNNKELQKKLKQTSPRSQDLQRTEEKYTHKNNKELQKKQTSKFRISINP
jgi:hypothetical protein